MAESPSKHAKQVNNSTGTVYCNCFKNLFKECPTLFVHIGAQSLMSGTSAFAASWCPESCCSFNLSMPA